MVGRVFIVQDVLLLLQDTISLPTGSLDHVISKREGSVMECRRRKRSSRNGRGCPIEYSTIVFTAAKYHVGYLTRLLRYAGHAASSIYCADCAQNCSRGISNRTLSHPCITDVASRGINLPHIANVVIQFSVAAQGFRASRGKNSSEWGEGLGVLACYATQRCPISWT